MNWLDAGMVGLIFGGARENLKLPRGGVQSRSWVS